MSTLNDHDRANLSAYLDGELDADTARDLEAKLTHDPEARAELDALERTWNLLEYLPKPEAPVNFTRRTMDRLAVEQKPRPAPTTAQMVPVRGSRFRYVSACLAYACLFAGSLWAGRLLCRAAESPDQAIVRHLDVVKRWRAYESVDDLEFLKALTSPDFFGDDADF